MATAIVRVCTYQGFVVAADGLRLKISGGVHTEHQKKIVYIQNERESIALGISGYSGDDFDIAKISEHALADLTTRKTKWGVSEYVKRLESMILKAAISVGDLPSQETPTISKMLLAGYLEQKPFMAEIELYQRTAKNKNSTLHSSSKSEIVAGLTKVEISGSDKVWWLLCDPKDQTFPEYRKSSLATFLNHKPLALSEGIELAETYIRACADHQKSLPIDQNCAGIGGHIHIATVSPAGQVGWVVGHEPIPPDSAPAS